MYKRFFEPPKDHYFLFGPRGTGKSTWLKHHYPDALWLDLLDPETLRFYAAGPERLRSIINEKPSTKIVVIDEVQKAPDILNVVHGLIEEKRGLQFVLTGSSSRKLKHHGVNLLGGRALLCHMPPFYAAELGKDFSLPKNLKIGMLPIVNASAHAAGVLKAYAGIYLKEEIQAEGLVRNVGDFARFLETMSFSHGSLLNVSNISRECHISRKTVDNYLLILEDLLLSFQLSVFTRKAKRQLSHQTKFYFFDSGVYYSIRPKNIYDVESEQEGLALEGLIAQHLKAWTDCQLEKHQLHFWRTKNQIEVDFIVSGPKCFLAIEVKNSKTVHPQDTRSLQIFCEDYPEATPILLYRGNKRYKENYVLCIPVDEFLLSIHPDKPIS